MKLRIALVGLAGLALGIPAGANEHTTRQLKDIGEGRGLYLRYCADCHGPAVEGVKPATTMPGPELTAIAKRDGRFDKLHVRHHIQRGSDRPWWSTVENDMPSWETRFKGPHTLVTVDPMMVRSVFLLTDYLEFAQADVQR